MPEARLRTSAALTLMAAVRIHASASRHQCECCPPERVCAWACVQGAGVMDIIIGAALAREGLAGWQEAEAGISPTREALWESFNR